jgi:peptide/nickel transport system substrate-binding protein
LPKNDIRCGWNRALARGAWRDCSRRTANITRESGSDEFFHDGNTSDSHDPGTYLTRQMIYLAHQYRSFLTMINPDNSLGPDLATNGPRAPTRPSGPSS